MHGSMRLIVVCLLLSRSGGGAQCVPPQPTRTRSALPEEQIDGCQEITLKDESRSPNHRGRLPGLAHSGKTDGDRRGPGLCPQPHPQRVRRVHELGRDQLGNPARRVLKHLQRPAALLCGPRRAQELQLLYLMGAYDGSNGKYTTPFSGKLLVDAFKKAGKKLDMGKCCLHFKELDDLELTSVAKVIAMSTPKEYLAYYKRVKGLA